MQSKEDVLKKINQKKENLTANITDPINNNIIKYNLINENTLWRAQTLFTKEPITIEWIRKFKKNKVFYDIGANVGIYSIFAALTSNVDVYSFEPESSNFYILMQNIVLNNLKNTVSPYPIGISNKTEITKLHISNFDAGSSHHTVGNNHLDHNNLKNIPSRFNQGIFSTTIDDLCFKWGLSVPSYLKIDVDGIESKIIEEAHYTLSRPDLESVLIEINENRKQDLYIINSLKKIGFNYDQSQVDKARRSSGPHKGYAEYLFYK